jgi:hypothetical protein
MPGSDAAAVDDQAGPVLGAHKRDHFFENAALVSAMALDAGTGRSGLAAEAFRIEAVNAEEANVAAFEGLAQRVDEAKFS